ncbi:protein FAM180A [Pygocentrus nattereri]|uniref:protein FAM180A n=1 Tax=Pygocentrus nattereri TaxID=42514 RepID=UPI0008145D3D|nr:protein FAM180A [Pygocentrus nattereri]
MLRFKCAWVLLCLAAVRGFWHRSDVSAVIHGGLSRPGFIRSLKEANMMFEFLLSGLVIDVDNNVAMRDQEMASTRQGRAFLALINDNIPKTVPAMEELLIALEDEEKSFSQSSFETLILGIIYSAYQVQKQEVERQEVQQKAWADVLGRLANVTFVHLRSY